MYCTTLSALALMHYCPLIVIMICCDRQGNSSSDLGLFFRKVGNELVALSGNYVDDLITAAPKEHRPALEKSLRSQFECSEPGDLPSDFQSCKSPSVVRSTMATETWRSLPRLTLDSFCATNCKRCWNLCAYANAHGLEGILWCNNV